MRNLLKNLHDRAETLEGKRLAMFLAGTFVVFLLIGAISNYTIKKLLKSNEIPEVVEGPTLVEEELDTYEGIITYIDPRTYPNDDISFYLADIEGREIILLKAKDQKLTVSEGFKVIAQGKLAKTKDGARDILVVEKVIFNQSQN